MSFSNKDTRMLNQISFTVCNHYNTEDWAGIDQLARNKRVASQFELSVGSKFIIFICLISTIQRFIYSDNSWKVRSKEPLGLWESHLTYNNKSIEKKCCECVAWPTRWLFIYLSKNSYYFIIPLNIFLIICKACFHFLFFHKTIFYYTITYNCNYTQ